MSKLFLSCVSSEFQAYRTLLTMDLQRARVDVRVQESFGVAGKTLLDALDDYIRECDAVVHLIGDGTGAFPESFAVDRLRRRYPDLTEKVPVLEEARISYTQWEAYLALYHGRRLHVYLPTPDAPRGPQFVPDDEARRSQAEHLKRIETLGWHRGTFESPERLSAYVLADLRDILPPAREDFVAAPSKLPKKHDSGVFEGRESVLADLDALWADALADKTRRARIVSLVAIGGAGKTTVVSRWKDSLFAREGHSGIERYFDWSFYSQGTRREGAADSTVFIVAALKFFGDPAMADSAAPAWDKGARLATLVAQHRTLLILDGLEPLQHPPGPQMGELKDDAIRALFSGLQQNSRGLCVVTTREPIADLASTRDTTTPQRRLDELTDVAGALVLRRHGVVGPEEELRRASAEVKGHALTLTLMGRYLKLAFNPPDIARRDCFDFADVNPEVQNGHAFRVFAEYERWFENEGRQVELAILRLLGLFDRPATPDCITALCEEPAIPGLTEPLVGLGERQWNLAVNRLRELDLVATVEWAPVQVSGYDEKDAMVSIQGAQQRLRVDLGPPRPFSPPRQRLVFRHSLDAHPLLREFFGIELNEAGSAPIAHDRLYRHLCASVPFWPEGRDGVLPLYQAIAHGCRASRHQEVCDETYFKRILRQHQFYSTKHLGLAGLDLAAVACFFAEPWQRVEETLRPADRAWLIATAAYLLRSLNRLGEAREILRGEIQMRIHQEDWFNAAISSSNLADFELMLGEVASAVATASGAVQLADRTGDLFLRMGKRAVHANVLHSAGRLDASRTLFAEAEAIQVEWQPQYPLLYGLQGHYYCDLLLAGADRSAWQKWMGLNGEIALLQDSPRFANQHRSELRALEQRVNQTGDWAAEARAPLLGIALDRLTLGRIHLLNALLRMGDTTASHLSQARYYLNIVLTMIREASVSHHLYRPLLPLAWLHACTGEWDATRQRLDEAAAVATRGGNPQKGWEGGMRLVIIDTLLHRARLFARYAGAYPWAGRTPRQDLEEAAALIEVCGYHRRDEELADAMAAIA